MNQQTVTIRLEEIVGPEQRPEKIAGGFHFTEGPIWNPREECLIFSDIIGNTMYRWHRKSGVAIFRQPSHMANGNTYDMEGRILTCEHATSRVSRSDGDGSYEVLVSHYKGLELNSPNDIVVRSDGSIYFTDPNSGRGPRYGIEREQQLAFQGVYRLDPETGSLILLIDDFSKPNGLCFSPDETRLFINDTDHQHIRVFDVNADGTIGNGRVWAKTSGSAPGVADGMKFDQAGNLYCCGSGGIHVFNSRGDLLGVIKTEEVAANFSWGGTDMCDLFITANTSLYRLRVNIPGYIQSLSSARQS